MFGRLILKLHDLAYRFCHPAYMLGYGAGYDRGHFDAFMEAQNADDEAAERAQIVSGEGWGFDIPDEELPF